MLRAALALALLSAPGGALAVEGDRPVLSGPELTRLTDDGHFKIHYTLEGVDRITDLTDQDPADGIPDAIDWAEAGAARVYQAFVDEDGWPPPLSDEGEGGDDRLDIYVRIIDARGYAHVEYLASGNYGTFVEINPAAAGGGREIYGSVAAHEVHHTLQYAVTVNLHPWIYEATSTYAQYLLFEDKTLDVLREALWAIRLGGAGEPLDTTGGQFEYAGMVWLKFLIDYAGGDRKLLLALWQAMALSGGWESGHEAVLPVRFGLPSLAAAAQHFAEWNWFACARDDGHHYDNSVLGCKLDNEVPTLPVTAYPASGTAGPVALNASAYVELVPDCESGDLTVTASPAGDMHFQLIEAAAGGFSPVDVQDVPAGGQASFEAQGWNLRRRVVLVGTAVGGGPTTFTYQALVSGAYVPPATLPPRTGVRVEPAEALRMVEGDQVTLAAQGLYGTCADGEDLSRQVTWQTTDAAIVRVEGGALTATGAGSAAVFAVMGSLTSNRVGVVVTAKPPPPPPPTSSDGCRASPGRPAAPAALLVVLLLAACVRRFSHLA